MIDVWSPEASTLREKVLEHAFLADLSRTLLLQGRRFEILRSEFDGYGHDLVVDVGAVTRHIQLKAMRADGKRAHVDIGLHLAMKPGGCVVWMLVDPATLKANSYLWLGGDPGEPLPWLGDRIARHSKGDSSGAKAKRPLLRKVPKSRFQRIKDIDDLVERLFGRPESACLADLRLHLISRGDPEDHLRPWLNRVRTGDFSAIPERPTFGDTLYLAHLVDGYELAGIKGPDEAGGVVAAVERDLASRGRVEPERIWAAMFLEHRRLRFENRRAYPAEERQLIAWCEQLRRALAG